MDGQSLVETEGWHLYIVSLPHSLLGSELVGLLVASSIYETLGLQTMFRTKVTAGVLAETCPLRVGNQEMCLVINGLAGAILLGLTRLSMATLKPLEVSRLLVATTPHTTALHEAGVKPQIKTFIALEDLLLACRL